MKKDGLFQVVSPCKPVASLPTQKTSMALEQQQQQQQQQENLEELAEIRVSASKKLRVVEGRGQPVPSLATVAEEEQEQEQAQDSYSEDFSEEAHGHEYAESIQGWAPPGLGVCQLWAQQASSLKRKKGASAAASFSPFSFSEPSSSLPGSSTERRQRAAVAVGFGIDDAVPATREDKAKLVGGYLGTSRPGYGDAFRTPVWWPAEVPWLKGVSISQMNNATLHTLVLAVKAHQRQERRQALASGVELPDGLFAFTPKTKKEMSRLIRSIQGRRLEYGKEGKRPLWWPKNCPWDNHKPLSTMKHAEVTSVFKAMVREGLLSDADVNGASCKTAPSPPSGTGKTNGNVRAVDSQAEDSGEATSDNDCQGGGGGDGHHQSASDSGSERSSSFWDGDDDTGAMGDVVDEISPLCETIDPDSVEDLPLPLPLPVQQRDACGLMPPSRQQEHPQQQHLAQQQRQQHLQFLLRQQQQQQQQQQCPLEFHGGVLGLNTSPLGPVTTTTTTTTIPGWAQQPLGKLSSPSSPSRAKVASGFVVASQAGKCSASSTFAPSLLLESVPCSPTKLQTPPPAAAPKTEEESAWQGRALFEELLLGGSGGGGLNGPQLCGLQGEDASAGAERMFGFSPLDDDLVFAIGGQVKPLH